MMLSGIFTVHTYAQRIVHPYVGAKSHETLSIDSIVRGEKATVFYLKVENKIKGGGWFCLSKHIGISDDAGGKKWLVNRSEGIPVCPEAHKFTRVGEILYFRLYAPRIDTLPRRISIRERCASHCMALEGIVTVPELSEALTRLEQGIVRYRQGDKEAALEIFNGLKGHPSLSREREYGYLLYILPRINYELKRPEAAREACEELKKSTHPQAKFFLEKLREIDFFKD